MIYIRYEIINDIILVSETMDFWSNYISRSFLFLQKLVYFVLVVAVTIVVMNEVSAPMPYF